MNMSLREQLAKSKKTLKPTVTVITRADGTRCMESSSGSVPLDRKGPGFVVDTNPDQIPVSFEPYYPRLFMGSQDCALPQVLRCHNIKNVLSVGVYPYETSPGVRYKYVEFLDLGDGNIWQLLDQTEEFILRGIDADENVLVHCNAGVSRSAALVIAFLMKHQRRTFEECHGIVKRVRGCIRPNDGFVKQLKCRQF